MSIKNYYERVEKKKFVLEVAKKINLPVNDKKKGKHKL